MRKSKFTIKKKLIYFLSFCFILFSCNNPNEIQHNINDNDSTNVKLDITRLNNVLKKYEEPSQIFIIPANKPSKVTGKKGTIISVNPNDFIIANGKPLGKNIKVELKELTNRSDLFRTNTQTVSDNKLIVSGGAYYIGMTSNDDTLTLKEGKTFNVQFPKISDDEMELFYGQRNDVDQINWKKANKIFKNPPKQSATRTENIKTIKKKDDIDAIMDYVENIDTTTTPEERKAKIKYQNNARVSNKVYEEIGLSELGWINCDRFLKVKERTDLYVNFNKRDSIDVFNVYLVFKDINSVMQSFYYQNNSAKFEDLPIGYKVRLIAYSVRDEKVFAYTSDLVITKGQMLTLNLKEINKKDFKNLIENVK